MKSVRRNSSIFIWNRSQFTFFFRGWVGLLIWRDDHLKSMKTSSISMSNSRLWGMIGKRQFDVILVDAPGCHSSIDRDLGDRRWRSDLHRSLLFSPLSSKRLTALDLRLTRSISSRSIYWIISYPSANEESERDSYWKTFSVVSRLCPSYLDSRILSFNDTDATIKIHDLILIVINSRAHRDVYQIHQEDDQVSDPVDHDFDCSRIAVYTCLSLRSDSRE